LSRFRGKIAILKGGYSDEREISLKTAENVEKALEELGVNFVSN
jgi:D-alanine-D-alanine ligase and related ATP-grasp enzymes